MIPNPHHPLPKSPALDHIQHPPPFNVRLGVRTLNVTNGTGSMLKLTKLDIVMPRGRPARSVAVATTTECASLRITPQSCAGRSAVGSWVVVGGWWGSLCHVVVGVIGFEEEEEEEERYRGVVCIVRWCSEVGGFRPTGLGSAERRLLRSLAGRRDAARSPAHELRSSHAPELSPRLPSRGQRPRRIEPIEPASPKASNKFSFAHARALPPPVAPFSPPNLSLRSYQSSSSPPN
ncbi:hypothetical protein CSPX01_13887 [Colletotrichum filicis]|nr:hypothetical protein CSPX01_13887 [Colletotrichum filicis]